MKVEIDFDLDVIDNVICYDNNAWGRNREWLPLVDLMEKYDLRYSVKIRRHTQTTICVKGLEEEIIKFLVPSWYSTAAEAKEFLDEFAE